MTTQSTAKKKNACQNVVRMWESKHLVICRFALANTKHSSQSEISQSGRCTAYQNTQIYLYLISVCASCNTKVKVKVLTEYIDYERDKSIKTQVLLLTTILITSCNMGNHLAWYLEQFYFKSRPRD